MGNPAAAGNTAGRGIDMIGVPFDGMGRSPGQAGAPRALRAAGLPAVFGPGAAMEPDLVLPSPVPQRAAGSGLLNERALLQMAGALYRQVRASLSAGRFPFVYGADCSVLLAAVPALRDVAGRAGLLFVDGHEDATPILLHGERLPGAFGRVFEPHRQVQRRQVADRRDHDQGVRGARGDQPPAPPPR